MVVVSNTSPVNYLVLIGQIEVLPVLYGSLLVPAAVVQELAAPGAPDPVRLWIAGPPSWVDVRRVVTGRVQDRPELHAGEREAIGLSLELKADLLLLDDFEAREYARTRGLSVIGTLGVLDEAAARGLCDFAAALDRLLRTSFRLAPNLTQRLRERDARRKRSAPENER